MIINHRDNDNYLELLRENKIPLGLGLGIPLDEHLRFKRGNFNIIMGFPNVGKTYWVLWYLLAHSVKHGLKHLISSTENRPEDLVVDLIELYTRQSVQGMSKQTLQKGKEFIEDHFDFVDNKQLRTIEDFMKQVQTQATENKYDSLMIDPHNSFLKPRGVNSHEYDYESASRLRLFASSFDVNTFLCMHANTEAMRRTYQKGHEYEGYPAAPNMADAEGGGKWGSRCDDFIIPHRLTQHPSEWMWTQIHIKKIKQTRTGGRPTPLNEPVMFKLENKTEFINGGKNALK